MTKPPYPPANLTRLHAIPVHATSARSSTQEAQQPQSAVRSRLTQSSLYRLKQALARHTSQCRKAQGARTMGGDPHNDHYMQLRCAQMVSRPSMERTEAQ
eukprot:772396-Pelagomonas_calceolata.AAC.4